MAGLNGKPAANHRLPESNNMRTIYLIACASKKLSHRANAQAIYDSTLFKLSLAYAKNQQPDAIYILSAKHGLLDLDTEIDPYDLTLNNLSAQDKRTWALRVRSEIEQKADLRADHFVFLAGQNYRTNLSPYMAHYEVPLEGLRIGEQLQYLKRATR